MKRLCLLSVLCVCAGCTFPIHHTLTDRPPYSAVDGKIIVTAREAYLVRYEAHPPQESSPSKDYRYYVTPASFRLLPDLKWLGPKILLPVGSRMRITRILRVTYPPLPSYFGTIRSTRWRRRSQPGPSPEPGCGLSGATLLKNPAAFFPLHADPKRLARCEAAWREQPVRDGPRVPAQTRFLRDLSRHAAVTRGPPPAGAPSLHRAGVVLRVQAWPARPGSPPRKRAGSSPTPDCRAGRSASRCRRR